jgi:hypothetical protein
MEQSSLEPSLRETGKIADDVPDHSCRDLVMPRERRRVLATGHRTSPLLMDTPLAELAATLLCELSDNQALGHRLHELA